MHSFLVALAFLTILPLRFSKLPDPKEVARSRLWFPAVGLLLGAVIGLWTVLVASMNLPPLGALLVLTAWISITGAFHIDGLTDLADGLFGGSTPEDRLEIMKDPHLGTFGMVAGVLLILAKFVLLQELLAHWTPESPWTVAASIAVARCLALTMAAGSTYPRAEGTGKILVAATTRADAISFLLFAILISWLIFFLRNVAICLGTILAVLQVLVPLLGVVALRWVCRRRLKGVTGDCLGAAIEVAEVLFLLATVLFLPLLA